MKNKKFKFKYVISACLLGIPCRWDQEKKVNKKAMKIFLQGKALILCPEIMGNLPTPRPACETVNGDGYKVLKGKAKVMDKRGKDYTKFFLKGSKAALKIVKQHGIKKAILRANSPTCGTPCIFSGKFDGKKIRGQGVFAALLKQNGIKIIGLRKK